MTPIDKKINRKVAAKAANGLILVAIGAGFAYYSETGPWLHRALDNFALIVMAVAAYSSFYDAWKLFRTPGHIRYLLAIREEFGSKPERSPDPSKPDLAGMVFPMELRQRPGAGSN